MAWASRPMRRSPERARTTASRRSPVPRAEGAVPASAPRSMPRTRESLVGTLPRRSRTSRSGRAASTWAARLGEPVPTCAPAGSDDSVAPSAAHRASRGSSRCGTAAMRRPGVGAVGRSLKEWTARSHSPPRRASRSCAANTPTPPSAARGAADTSPWVRTTSRLTRTSSPRRAPASSIARATVVDWASARRDPLVPRTNVRVVIAVLSRPLGRGRRRRRCRFLRPRRP